MAKPSIRLVYSDTSIKKSKDNELSWDLENAKQLSLFEDFDKLEVIFLPIAEITSHTFMKALEERSPRLVLDTRDFPDFFSVFISTTMALEEFHRRGIEYSRISIVSGQVTNNTWEKLGHLKSLLVSHLNQNTNAPIFILTSTLHNLQKISGRLKGYISQEVSEAKFEEISY